MNGLNFKSTKEALKPPQNSQKVPKKAKISGEIRKSSRKRKNIDYSEKENSAPPKKVEKSAQVHEKENPDLAKSLPKSLPKNLPKNRGFVCQICPISFKTKTKLERHDDSVHKKLKLFGCLYCTNTFSTKEIANQHSKAVHEELKPFKCEHCAKFFATKFNRDDHISTVHEGKMPFKCPICEKPFGLKSNMTKHVATHSNTKNFVCPKLECNSSFKSQKGLNRHLKENCKK